MTTPAPEDPAAQDPVAAADAMREATERLREQAWMVAGTTRPSPQELEVTGQDATVASLDTTG